MSELPLQDAGVGVTGRERQQQIEALARAFHEAYERLAPAFGYETRKESAVPWEDVPEPNRRLMEAVVAEVVAARLLGLQDTLAEAREALRGARVEHHMERAPVDSIADFTGNCTPDCPGCRLVAALALNTDGPEDA